jgi:hypothetical protein
VLFQSNKKAVLQHHFFADNPKSDKQTRSDVVISTCNSNWAEGDTSGVEPESLPPKGRVITAILYAPNLRFTNILYQIKKGSVNPLCLADNTVDSFVIKHFGYHLAPIFVFGTSVVNPKPKVYGNHPLAVKNLVVNPDTRSQIFLNNEAVCHFRLRFLDFSTSCR